MAYVKLGECLRKLKHAVIVGMNDFVRDADQGGK